MAKSETAQGEAGQGTSPMRRYLRGDGLKALMVGAQNQPAPQPANDEDYRAEKFRRHLHARRQSVAMHRRRRKILAQLGRIRYQLLAGAVLGVWLPSEVRPRVEKVADPLLSYDHSLLGSFVAMVLGVFLLRKLTAFPGVKAMSYILPTFAMSYFATVMAYAVLRIDLSRWQYSMSFTIVVVVFWVMHLLSHRGSRTVLAAVPGGDVGRLSSLAGVDLRYLEVPQKPPRNVPIVADMRAELGSDWERFIADAAMSGRAVYNAKHVFESLSGRVLIEHLSENTFGGTLTSNSIYMSAKRSVDFTLAVIVLALIWPILLFVGILIRLDSPGPALFMQIRMGRGATPFTVIKFRTMRNDISAPSVQSQMTQENDPRITKLGAFLRRTRIDELPQIINILKGEMSWIGPRPEAVLLSRLYETQIPFYRYRHVVRPGITGWAQVNQGHVTNVEDANKKLQYDFFYVKNFSLWLDLLVLMRTVRVIFSGYGAK